MNMPTFMQVNKGELSNIALFSLGKFVSVLGHAIYTFAIGLYVLQLTDSGLSFATTLVLGTIPMVMINPFAGVLADRIDKKKLVVVMDLTNGVLFIVMFVISSVWGLSLAMVYTSTFLISIVTTVFSVSIEIAKPNLVSGRNLINLNAISKIIDSVSTILAPMIGGLIYALFDIKLFILFCGVSYLLSSISEIFIDFDYNHASRTKQSKQAKFVEDLKEGFNYISKTGWLLKVIGVFVCLNFFIGLTINVPLPFILNQILELSSEHYGIIQSGFPIGMIMGALIVKKVRERLAYDQLLKHISIILSILMGLIGFPLMFVGQIYDSFYLLYYSLVTVMLGFCLALIDILLFYQLQTTIPEAYRGRVISIGIALAKLVLPLGLILSGSLVNRLPAAVLPMLGGSGFFIINLLMFRRTSSDRKVNEHNSG